MLKHLDWLEEITKVILVDVNVSLEDYIDSMSTPGVPLDFIAIVVISRLYHIHVAVFTNSGIWSTSRSRPYKDALFGLVFNGGFAFTETVTCGKGAQYRAWLDAKGSDGTLPSHARKCFPHEMKLEAKVESVSEALRLVNNAVLCDHRNTGDCQDCDSLDSEHLKGFIGDQANIDRAIKSATADFLNKVKRENQDKESTMEYSEDDIPEDSQHEPGCDSDENNNNATPPSDIKIERRSSDDHDLMCHEKLNVSISLEKDPKIEQLWHSAQSTINVAQQAFGFDSAPQSASTSTAASGDRSEHEFLLQCPVCFKKETTQKACLSHISTVHPDYKFMCSVCSKLFSTYNTKYRHEKEHSQEHVCGDCGKGFPFKSELNRHAGVHASVLPYPCDKCEKRFAQAKSLKRHKVIHTDFCQRCTKCDKTFNTPDRYYTHFRGEHGRGYDTKCGINYKWPAQRARHHESCDKCLAIIAEEERAKKRRFSSVQKKDVETAKQDGDSSEDDNIADTKRHIQFKLENIARMKSEMP